MLLLCLPLLILLRGFGALVQTPPGVTDHASAVPATGHMVYRIPYRLDETQHLAVRARINGQGPFNFIIDTGAPTVYLTAEAAARCQVKPDSRGWGTFAHMEIEGGVMVEQVQARIEEPFQLQGMNALGLAAEHLDGILGYSLLSRFRIQIDMTQPKMLWSPSGLRAGIPTEMGRVNAAERAMMKKAASSQKEMEGLAKMATTMLGRQSAPSTVRRGFFGIELEDTGAGPHIRAVTPGSPAAQAGLLAGDVVLKVAPSKGAPVSTVKSAAVLRATANVAPGEGVVFVVRRGPQRLELTVRAGTEGF